MRKLATALNNTTCSMISGGNYITRSGYYRVHKSIKGGCVVQAQNVFALSYGISSGNGFNSLYNYFLGHTEGDSAAIGGIDIQ